MVSAIDGSGKWILDRSCKEDGWLVSMIDKQKNHSSTGFCWARISTGQILQLRRCDDIQRTIQLRDLCSSAKYWPCTVTDDTYDYLAQACLRATARSKDSSIETLLACEQIHLPELNKSNLVFTHRHSKTAFILIATALPLGAIGLIAGNNKKIESQKIARKEAETLAEECIKVPYRDCSSLNESLLRLSTKHRLEMARVNYLYNLEKRPETKSLSYEEKSNIISLYRPCKKYIGEVMGRDPQDMNSDYANQALRVVGISYVRGGDGTVWRYECKSDGKNIYWRTANGTGAGQDLGRWRTEDSRPLLQ